MERRILELLLAGKSQGQVGRELKVGDRRVRRVLVLGEEYGYLKGNLPLPPFPQALFPEPEVCHSKGVSENDLAYRGSKRA